MTADDLDRFRSGDERLFTRLVAEHSPRLLGVALRLTRDRAAAHDLVQDTWVRAYTSRHSFSGRGSLLGWLLAVLRTEHLTGVRTEARRARRAVAHARLAPDRLDENGEIGAVGVLEADDAQAQVILALAQLGERQRDVVALRVLEGVGTAETARRLGIAEGTVKATLAQALRRLRALVQHTPGDCDR